VFDFAAFLLTVSAVKALWLPAALAAGLTVYAPSSGREAPVALAMIAGLLVGTLLIRPLPLIPPIGGIGWLPYMSLAGFGLGYLAARPRWRLAANMAFSGLLAPSIAILIGRTEYTSFSGVPAWMAYALLGAVGIVIFVRIALQGKRPATPRSLFLSTLALGALGWIYGTRLGLHGMTLMAAIGAAALATRLTGQTWSRTASYAGSAAYLTLAITMIYWSDSFILPVAITFLIFFTPDLASLLLPADDSQRERLAAFLAVVFAAASPIAYLVGS